MPNLIVSAVTKYDGKGLAKGRKDINAFQKTVTNLAKTFVGLYSATKLAQFGKSSVKAFLADNKAAAALGKTLDNTGNSFAKIGVEKFIGSLQKQTGVLDDFLRPAFQGLLVATGSVTKAQEGLSVALDVAAGTSSDVVTTSKAISKAYAGNTTALTKLIPGIDKAVLASKDLNAINKELTRLFGGQAAVAAGTFSGQLDILNAAAADAKETIGKGLVTALQILSGDGKGSLNKTANGLSAVSQAFATLTIAVALNGQKLARSDAFNIPKLMGFKTESDVLNFLDRFGLKLGDAYRLQVNAAMPAVLDPKALVKADIAAKAKLKTDKAAAAAAAKLAALTKKAETDKLALKKAGSKFDLAQIQIEAALQYGIDNETKLRLELQRAILKEDVAKAAELQAALLANEAKTKDLANLLATLPKADDPFADWPAIIARINGLLKDLKIPGSATALLAAQGLTYNADTGKVTDTPTVSKPIVVPVSTSTNGTTTATTAAVNTPEVVQAAVAVWSAALDAIAAGGDSGFAGAARRAGYVPDPPVVNVTVNAGVVGSEQVIADAVQTVIQNLGRYGTSLQYAGAIAI